jgi:hypothetical protein
MRIFALLALLASAAGAAELPPHMTQVWGGWLSCEPGYVMRNRECIDGAAIPRGPQVVISAVPSAGEGSLQPQSCPSGGCGSPVIRREPARYGYPYRTLSGFYYLPPSNPYSGGTLVRDGPTPMTRTIVQLPFLW